MILEFFYLFFILIIGFFYLFGFKYLFKKLGFEKIEKIEQELLYPQKPTK